MSLQDPSETRTMNTAGQPHSTPQAPPAPTNPLEGLTTQQIEAIKVLFAPAKKYQDVPLKEPKAFDGDPKKA